MKFLTKRISCLGKTTLLNVLSQRTRRAAKVVEGDMRINSKPYSTTTLKQVSGYVMQDDLLFAHITVEETLRYAATLRLANTTEDQRKAAVEDVIQQLGLESCRRTIVGMRISGVFLGVKEKDYVLPLNF